MDDKKHFPQVGIVTAVDSEAYRAKAYMPLIGDETSFIRISSLYVGAGWGFVSLPKIGQEVVVTFLNGDFNDGIITGYSYSDESDSPPESSELYLLHKSGSSLRFSNNGDVKLHAAGNLILTGATIQEN